MAPPLAVLSSMATRVLLGELGAGWDGTARLEAVGGVDAARRVREGEAVDVVVLAAGAMAKLEADGVVRPGSLMGIAVSAIAVAVRDGDDVPDLSDETTLRRAILAAGRTGYSTGPSGEHLLRLLDRWGVRGQLGDRLVQAPPGTPVGRLLAEGAVDLAFQQRSELMDIPGITLAFPLPQSARSDTVFTAGIAQTSSQPEAARGFIEYLASPQHDAAKRRGGMEPIQQ